MCVLTFVPKGQNDFILTSNRDEAVLRAKALPPKKIKVLQKEIIAPVDPVSKGTWIATSKNCTAVLLNGGHEKHTPNPPYRQSRGQVILDFFKFENVQEFFDTYKFEGLEPFTLIILNHETDLRLHEIVWCKNQKKYTEKNPKKPNIWSSATLYTAEAVEKRRNWFFEMLEHYALYPNATELIDFHINGGKGDRHDSIHLTRTEDLKTLSTTQIEVSSEGHLLYYQDFLQNFKHNYRIL